MNDNNPIIQSSEPAIITVKPSFVLLFSTQLNKPFEGFGSLPPAIAPFDEQHVENYLETMADTQIKILGKSFYEARRLLRTPLGQITIEGASSPMHCAADVYLLTHTSQTALWEVWIDFPTQPFKVNEWIGWLDEYTGTLIEPLWRTLGLVNKQLSGQSSWSSYYPTVILKIPTGMLESFHAAHGADLVRLLFIDRSSKPFKSQIIKDELDRDYSLHEGTISLFGQKSALSVCEDGEYGCALPYLFPYKINFPFFITLEILLLERAILSHLHKRFSDSIPSSIENLLLLKQEMLDILEEYYGSIIKTTYFSNAMTKDGEQLLGLNDLYDAVMDRLETASFAITTRYQKQTTLLGLWLTVIFGATEIGFIASGIAVWYYQTEVSAVLGWTIIPSIFTAFVLWVVLRKKVQ